MSGIVRIESYLYFRYTIPTMAKRLLVFTGGGLSPSLNVTLAGVIGAAQKRGWQIFGGRQGWASLLPGGRNLDVSRLPVKNLEKSGGTFLQSSRTNPWKYPGGRGHVLHRCKKLGLEAIVAIGGDDTLSAAQQFHLEEGLPIFGIPKTIDNDIPGTYVTPGYATAAERLGQMVYELHHRAAHAFSRIYIVESMGLHAGWLAAAGCLGGADLIVPPEKPVSMKRFLQALRRVYKENGGYATVVVSQEAQFTGGMTGLADDQVDDYAVSRHQFICLALKKLVKDQLGIDTKAILPGNLLESSNPNRIDRKLSLSLGRTTVARLARGETPALATIQLRQGKLVVEHCLWHEVDLSPTPYLPEDYFDFKNFQVRPKFWQYLRSLGLYKIE